MLFLGEYIPVPEVRLSDLWCDKIKQTCTKLSAKSDPKNLQFTARSEETRKHSQARFREF